MPLHTHSPTPCENSVAGERGAIITHDHARLPPLGDEPRQLTHDTVPRDQGIWHRCEVHSGHVSNHVEHAEPPA